MNPAQPFRLLDLPPELIAHILRSLRYADDICDEINDFSYDGEYDSSRYEMLRLACLSGRSIFPFAQDELYSRLDFRSEASLVMFLEAVEASDGLKRATERKGQAIFLAYESGQLSRSLSRRLGEALPGLEIMSIEGLTISSAHLSIFEKLKHLWLRSALLSTGSAWQCRPVPQLQSLRMINVSLPDHIFVDGYEAAFFSPEILPKLVTLRLDFMDVDAMENVPWQSLLPQIERLELCVHERAEITWHLAQTRMLKALSIVFWHPVLEGDHELNVEYVVERTEFTETLGGLDRLYEFKYYDLYNGERRYYTTALDTLRLIMGVIQDSNVKRLSLLMEPETHGKESLQEWQSWQKFKIGTRAICREKGIEVVKFGDGVGSVEELASDVFAVYPSNR